MPASSVGVLNEGPLHASLKEWYRLPGDVIEQPLEGFIIDLVREGVLIEIQTRGFSAMRRKLDHLLDRYPIRLVHPIAAAKWLLKIDSRGEEVSRRKSPKQGIAADVCGELVSFPSLLSHPNFTLEVLMIQEEQVLREDPKRGWRRSGWATDERRLVDVVDHRMLETPADLLGLIPSSLPNPFTTADLAAGLGRSRHMAQEVAYCLRTAGALEAIGRNRRGIQYRSAI